MAMRCPLCNNDAWSQQSKITLCAACKQLNRCDLFARILAFLRGMQSSNQGFEAIREKCIQFNALIEAYPLFITPVCRFDVDEHDSDRVALHYLRTYVLSEDNNTLQTYHPVKMDSSDMNSLYQTIALLCRLDLVDGAMELRIRNVIDMVINAEAYRLVDEELHSCMRWADTWRYFVLEQLYEDKSIKGANAVFTLCLASLSNIINMRIRSIYPKVPGGSDDLRKRLDHLFAPLDVQSNATTLPTITLLWTNVKKISSLSTSSMWMPDCVIPLLPKPETCTGDIFNPPKSVAVAAQNPSARSFYRLTCFCPVTQSALNELVSQADQQKHSEAEMKKGDTKVPEFRCPKCSKTCDDYRFDWGAVSLFRQNFNGARLTYILVDMTSSMTTNLLRAVTVDKKSSLPRILQTKEAIKQLLKEIGSDAGPLDQVILSTFDDRLRKPALIPLSPAMDSAQETHLARIDAIELSPWSVKTHLYTVLKEVYEMFERQPFLYIDFFIFSDGVDTSPRKNDRAYQAILRGLSEKVGAKCHFVNCGSASDGFSVAAWLGDEEANCCISGGIAEIQSQVKVVYRKDRVRNPDLSPMTIRFRGRTLDVPLPTVQTYMTDSEAASIPKPRLRLSPNNQDALSNESFRHSNPNLTNIEKYLDALPSATRSRSSTGLNVKSNLPEVYGILTRNPNARKLSRT